MISCPICKSLSVMHHTIKNNYTILRCDTCQYGFVDPRPTQKILDAFYEDFDYKDLDSAESRIRSDAKLSINFINKYLSISNHCLLDLGCGRGYLLDEARLQNWNVEGVDYSSTLVKYAKQQLKLTVYKSDIYKFETKKKYDLIIVNQVIEHIPDINKLIKKIKKLLVPKGLVYIATPNFQSATARIFKDSFEHITPPEHINYFGINSLTRLLEKHNFRILRSGTWGYPENLAGIIKQLVKPRVIHSLPRSGPTLQSNNKIYNSIKYLLFDKLFCGNTYRFLDVFKLGINLQIIAQSNE